MTASMTADRGAPANAKAAEELRERDIAVATGWLERECSLRLDGREPVRVGRFGSVVAMTDEGGRRVAVKILHEGHDCATPAGEYVHTGNDLWLASCRRHGRSHRNIVNVHDVYHIPGPNGERLTAYRMEWIDLTLQEVDLSHRRPREAMLALKQIGDGLCAALGQLQDDLLVHGDIHGSNIGLRQSADGAYEPVLIDLDRLRRDPAAGRHGRPPGQPLGQVVAPQEDGPRVLDMGRDVWCATRTLLRCCSDAAVPHDLVELIQQFHDESATFPRDAANGVRDALHQFALELSPDDDDWPDLDSEEDRHHLSADVRVEVGETRRQHGTPSPPPALALLAPPSHQPPAHHLMAHPLAVPLHHGHASHPRTTLRCPQPRQCRLT